MPKNPKLIGTMPPDQTHRCGYLATCERLAVWHVMVPKEVLPDGWSGLLAPEESTCLCICDDPKHMSYVVDNFPVRVVHEHDQDLCLRDDTHFLDDGCVEEPPEWMRVEAAEELSLTR